jgi:phage shock protein PspC (stress-responsive transcriptional regulator)
MTCGHCRREIAAYSNFCYFCGNRQEGVAYEQAGSVRRLRRSTTDKVFGGVCGGLGDYLDVDPVLIRVIWAVLAISGIGIIVYLVAWMVIDQAPAGGAPVTLRPASPAGMPRRLRRSATDVKWAGVCGGIAAHLDVDSTIVRLMWAILTVIPGAFVGGFLAYLVAWMVMPGPEPRPSVPTGQPVAHNS